ncbi:MAG TPA: DUF1501 domain-containing protein, partial [Pirellulaceae bacterium]|nr:DUF1501 domain-containing protein [Pirellulaceae bacterium]
MNSSTARDEAVRLARRRFFNSAASGAGMLALASLLRDDGLLGGGAGLSETLGARRAVAADDELPNPLAPRASHFPGTAKRCICIFLAGGTSHLELFDPKPKLRELDGQPIPESFLKGVRFSFVKPSQSVLMGSRFGFKRYGECGMEMSELLPHIGVHADKLALVRSMHHGAFDHAPGELEMLTGRDQPGRPSFGAWLTYGLGSESRNLPGFVALINQRGPVARAMAWGAGYLPSVHQGVLLRNQGEPILNLETPSDIDPRWHRAQLDAIRRLNQLNSQRVRDPEIDTRIAAYELAYRMQSAAPELIDMSQETRDALEAYGVQRPGQQGVFARNCLLARRMVERGVRVVTLFQRTWDQHKNLERELKAQCQEVDQPIGALLADLKQRGLLDSTLVIWATEFGRTAITENAKPGGEAGRDHHPHCFSLWMAGGGVRGGQVYGQSDELGWHVAENPVHTHDFHATLLHLFGFDHERLTYRHRGLDVRLTDVGGRVV